MNEENEGINVRLTHLEKEVEEIKLNNKEISKDMTAIRESHLETKFYMKSMTESVHEIMDAIKTIREEPIKNLKYYKVLGYGFAITYIMGTIFGVIKAFCVK